MPPLKQNVLENQVAYIAHLRLKQIRVTLQLLNLVEAVPGGGRLMRALAHWPLTGFILDQLTGFHRVFPGLREAAAAARPYAQGEHSNPANSTVHLALAQKPRPSDYAALFHLRQISSWGRIFDLGGNVGNLFYCYEAMLPLSPNLIWQVYDLAEIIERGQNLAAARAEARLNFTTGWQEASGAELLIASGSLHYFAKPL